MSFLDDYEPVADRLEKFWTKFPMGCVETRLVNEAPPSRPGEVILFEARLYVTIDGVSVLAPAGKRVLLPGESRLISTGFAHQRVLEAPPMGRNRANESAPEWTSPYEVCETSAIGRALANAGFASKTSRASREEVAKTETANQLFDVRSWIEPLTDEQKAVLRTWWQGPDGPGRYPAGEVPGAWLDTIQDQLEKVQSVPTGGKTAE